MDLVASRGATVWGPRKFGRRRAAKRDVRPGLVIVLSEGSYFLFGVFVGW